MARRTRWAVVVLGIAGVWAAAGSSAAAAPANAGAANAVESSAGDTESQRFAAFLESVYQNNLAASPALATADGLAHVICNAVGSTKSVARAKGPHAPVTIKRPGGRKIVVHFTA